VSYDAWKQAGPHEDCPSTENEPCDIGGCGEPWAWEAERRNGPRKLRLCEGHATRWLEGRRVYEAELEEVAGRELPRRPRPGTQAALAKVGHGTDKARQARRPA
jgi:hypothetical protein